MYKSSLCIRGGAGRGGAGRLNGANSVKGSNKEHA